LLDPRLVDPGSTLIQVGAYGPMSLYNLYKVYMLYFSRESMVQK